MIQFEETISSILASDTDPFHERDPETFFASHIGFCPRQLYLTKLGLTATDDRHGQYKATRLIQAYLEEQLTDHHTTLESAVSIHIEEAAVTFIGRCNLYDPTDDIVYALKARNGWYKFSPPVDRHLDQLHVYMKGLDVDRGKLVYVSKNDIGDIREWPPPHADPPHIAFDHQRYEQLVQKATRIWNAIWTDGIATTPDDIPFQRCGCYFCRDEQLAFPAVPDTEDLPDASAPPETAQPASATDHTPPTADPSTLQHDRAVDIEADGGAEATITTSTTPAALHVDETHVPRALRELEVWVLWDERSKCALAPWQSGTMYPCEWAATKPVDPRRSFETAQMIAELPIDEIHHAWPFPDHQDLPDRITPAVLLPHDPPEPPLTFVDLDNVRDPDTGRVPGEVHDIIDALGGYTELSSSETGLHVYVYGGLPDGTGAFTAPLAEQGSIEIYDHSRFTAGTWRHVAETPRDTIPNAGTVIHDLVRTY